MDDAVLKLLFVDDDPAILAVSEAAFNGRYAVDCAGSGQDALQRIKRDGPYAVMVADRSMPGMNGVELLEKARQLAPETVRIMLTGDTEQQAAIDAINRGQAFYFLAKPCSGEALIEAVESGVN